MIKENTNDMIKAFNPDECLFVGTLNELQQSLQEVIRQRIKAENKLSKMRQEDEYYNIRNEYLKICQSWENTLTDELIKRMPKDQRKLL